MDVAKTISDSIALAGDVVKAVEAALASGGGLVAEGEALLLTVLEDAGFKAAVAAVIADIKS